ncbi:hypothetical protein ACIBI9_25620 [Nonomuraea sp. NPDC050451]|uniref:hypothetical protein n=1 Tax=Nonomuraea sp. NPDC050451 TaxID=3364364 RepID=UPI0037AC89A4
MVPKVTADGGENLDVTAWQPQPIPDSRSRGSSDGEWRSDRPQPFPGRLTPAHPSPFAELRADQAGNEISTPESEVSRYVWMTCPPSNPSR